MPGKITLSTLDKSDLLLCIGSGLIFYGTHQIYPPAAFLMIGSILIGIAIVQARPHT